MLFPSSCYIFNVYSSLGKTKLKYRVSIYFYAVFSLSGMSNSLWSRVLQPTRLLCPRGFYRQEYWNGLTCPPPGDLPNPGIKFLSLMCPELAGGFFNTSIILEAPYSLHSVNYSASIQCMCVCVCVCVCVCWEVYSMFTVTLWVGDTFSPAWMIRQLEIKCLP